MCRGAAGSACFDAALADVGLTAEPLRTELHDDFVWSTGRLSEHPGSADAVAADLTVPRWPREG